VPFCSGAQVGSREVAMFLEYAGQPVLPGEAEHLWQGMDRDAVRQAVADCGGRLEEMGDALRAELARQLEGMGVYAAPRRP